jgi:micrococcal nuclease
MVPYFYKADLIRVIDGDTLVALLDLGFECRYEAKVRFAGVNAPESRTRDLREKALAKVATDRVVELLEGAELQVLSFGKGKFGRVLGAPYYIPAGRKKAINLCDQLLKEGLCRKYSGGKRKPWFSK